MSLKRHGRSGYGIPLSVICWLPAVEQSKKPREQTRWPDRCRGTYTPYQAFNVMVSQAKRMRRYRAELQKRRPDLADDELDSLTGDEVYADLRDRYPDEPERAIDVEVDDWDHEDMPRPDP